MTKKSLQEGWHGPASKHASKQASKQGSKEARKEANKQAKPQQQDPGLGNMHFVLVLIIQKVTPSYALEKAPTALGPQRDLHKTELPVREVSPK